VPDEERDAELADLRQRLADAEETLRAIYQGEVDALVVRGPDGPQVFTLRGAQEPYRILVERMHEGALTLSTHGLILYCNRHFATLLERPLEQIVGRPLAEFVPATDIPALNGLLSDGARWSVRRELTLHGRDGFIPTLAAANPLVDEDSSAVLLIVTDLTAQKHSEEIAAAGEFARSILEQATDAVLVCNRAGRITHASFAADRLFGQPLSGQIAWHTLPLHIGATEPGDAEEPATSVQAVVHDALAGKSIHRLEASLDQPGRPRQHFLVSAGPLRDRAGEPIGCILTLTDITERKQAEDHQTMLVAELNHRVKNILAVVQSVASQTVASSPSIAQFRAAFEGRLRAISLAHDILTQLRWAQVDLGHLVERSLAPYRGGARVAWSGPTLFLPAQNVVSLAMVLHELSTNAAKYGAFSNGSGRVEIAWGRVDDRMAELSWAEHGGPALADDPVPGFGNKLISRVMSYDLQGSAKMRYEPDGFRCRLTFRLPTASAVQDEHAEAALAPMQG
jgi:two-component sensor histidine kinase/PAS domain-containing protein